MDTSLIDSAISSAVSVASANPQRVAPTQVAGWPSGTSATVATNTYVTLDKSGNKVSGFQVIGTVVFPNGYKAIRIVDVGPNSHTSKEWPADIEAQALAFSESRAQQALNIIGRAFPSDQQTALLFKWSGVVASGSQADHPKLAAVYAWISSVSAAALTGAMFPQSPQYSFVELMAETPASE